MMRDRSQPLEPVARDRLVTHLEREVRDDGREIAVAGAFAVAVDRPLHLCRTAEHTRERVGHAGAGVVVEMDGDLHVAAEVTDDFGDRRFDLVRQRAAIGVAQHEVARTVGHRGFEHAQRELGIAGEAVEEVLGIEQHLHPGVAQELDRVADHRDALVERGAQCFGHVVVPRLADDANGTDVRLDQMAQRVVAVDLALHPPGRPERDEGARLELQLVGHPAEQLVVLGVRTGPARLDVVHAEPVELLRDPQLVLDRERDALQLRPVPERGVVYLYVHAATTSGPLSPVRRAATSGPPVCAWTCSRELMRAHTSLCTCRSRPARLWRTRLR